MLISHGFCLWLGLTLLCMLTDVALILVKNLCYAGRTARPGLHPLVIGICRAWFSCFTIAVPGAGWRGQMLEVQGWLTKVCGLLKRCKGVWASVIIFILPVKRHCPCLLATSSCTLLIVIRREGVVGCCYTCCICLLCTQTYMWSQYSSIKLHTPESY